MMIKPSDTYKKLYFRIIDPLLVQICKSNINYCIKEKVDKLPIQYVICGEFENYKTMALKNMHGDRLDRHKLASCICGAIIKVRPLEGCGGAAIVRNANEKLALFIGLNVIKAYMLDDLFKESAIAPGEKLQVKNYLKESYDMEFPDNICDTQEYVENFANALYWTHEECELTKAECFRYDIWAYAKIFYHLELFNRPKMRQCLEDYLKRL
ncbi:MAG: hypothetical protein NC180_05465 [Muribaculaceae bacterium]|nr:hypothetical protein [Roseburia sp.]MCM1430549.1 hypothetical protein [Muribaculaceae bacterium]MCM1492656.1 hypothetical protein [Muribaculaceae bacterium]